MSIIDIKNLSFSYNKELVLENINLHVEQKEFLAIIGPWWRQKHTFKTYVGLFKTSKRQYKTF